MALTDEKAIETFNRVGGPAFPCQWGLPEGGELNCPGLTLLDWFAGQALVAIGAEFNPHADGDGSADKAARSYAMAAAMIAERAKFIPAVGE